jgi:pyridoxamine 5'-phosphate oxidase
VIAGREELDRAMAKVEARFAGVEVLRPPHWGGFLVRPQRVELWQGRPNRLHDRVRYQRDGDGWRTERLAP